MLQEHCPQLRLVLDDGLFEKVRQDAGGRCTPAGKILHHEPRADGAPAEKGGSLLVKWKARQLCQDPALGVKEQLHLLLRGSGVGEFLSQILACRMLVFFWELTADAESKQVQQAFRGEQPLQEAHRELHISQQETLHFRVAEKGFPRPERLQCRGCG